MISLQKRIQINMIDNTSKEFIRRHIGPSETDIKNMLKVVGADSLDVLIKKTVPDNIMLKDELKNNKPTSIIAARCCRINLLVTNKSRNPID